jgi:hypothetical protein
VKKAVVYCKKISNLALSNLGRRDLLIVDLQTLGRKLFQTPYFSPIEVSNDKTLAPVYPQQFRKVPLFHCRNEYREDVGQDQNQC